MADERSPFLAGALAWVYDGRAPTNCEGCGFSWDTPPDDALGSIAASPERYTALLAGRDGLAEPDDGGWNATSYLWHLTDLARSWSERWVQLKAAPGSLLAGWDPDVLAEARNYRNLPSTAATWALATATETFVDLSRRIDHDTEFEHGDWGTGTVGEGLRWLAHEFVHHRLDVDERAR